MGNLRRQRAFSLKRDPHPYPPIVTRQRWGFVVSIYNSKARPVVSMLTPRPVTLRRRLAINPLQLEIKATSARLGVVDIVGDSEAGEYLFGRPKHIAGALSGLQAKPA
jgi:hypothetical protein